jgi:hypothetical protein
MQDRAWFWLKCECGWRELPGKLPGDFLAPSAPFQARRATATLSELGLTMHEFATPINQTSRTGPGY